MKVTFMRELKKNRKNSPKSLLAGSRRMQLRWKATQEINHKTHFDQSEQTGLLIYSNFMHSLSTIVVLDNQRACPRFARRSNNLWAQNEFQLLKCVCEEQVNEINRYYPRREEMSINLNTLVNRSILSIYIFNVGRGCCLPKPSD